MLAEGKKAGVLAVRGDNKATRCTKPSTSEIGITRNESSQWQRLAKVPEREYVKAVGQGKKCTKAVTLPQRPLVPSLVPEK